MSLSQMEKGYGGPPSGYPYPDAKKNSSQTPQPLPTLPPMSSLLRHEQEQPPVHPQQSYPPNPYVARQFQPPYNMVKHAMWPSPLTPDEPGPQPYYSPPRPMSPDREEMSHSSPVFRRELPPQILNMPAAQEQPLVQRRQIKKITQRRMDYLKERQEVRESRSEYNGPTGSIKSTPSPFGPHDPIRSASMASPQQELSAYASGPPESNYYPRRKSSQHDLSPYARKESGPIHEAPIPPPPRQMSSASHSQASQPSRAISISGLLSSGPSPSIPRPSLPQYSIAMRQQPLAARACGFGERDRRVIDPPPILQMTVTSPTSSPAELSALLRQPYAVVHCTLWDPQTDSDDTAMPSSTSSRQQRRLMGTLVASPFVGLDEHNVEGCFFCFPDLSVRTPGTYSLKFSLVNLDPSRMRPGMSEPVRSTVKSSVFHVYNAKDFGGMRASTELTKSLKHQGCLISVKKGNAKSNNRRGDDDDEEDDDDDDEGGDGRETKKAKRTKR